MQGRYLRSTTRVIHSKGYSSTCASNDSPLNPRTVLPCQTTPSRNTVPPSGLPSPVACTNVLRLKSTGDVAGVISVWCLNPGDSLNNKNMYLQRCFDVSPTSHPHTAVAFLATYRCRPVPGTGCGTINSVTAGVLFTSICFPSCTGPRWKPPPRK